MILAAPVLAESHICDKVRFDEVVVVVNELAVCLCIEMQIQLFLVMVGELRTEELVHKVLVALSDLFGNSLRVILARTDIAHWETIHEPRYQTTATEHRIVYHAIKDIGLTGKTDAHVGLFEDYARSGCSVADIGLAVPRFQQEVEIRNVVGIASAEITEHSGFIGYHKECAVFFKQIHKRFGCNIVNRYSAEIARWHIAQLCSELGYLLGGNVFLLFKCFELALKQLSFCLHRVDVLLVVLVPVMSELDIRSLYKRDNRRLLEARLCYRQGVEYQRLSMVTLCRHTVNS